MISFKNFIEFDEASIKKINRVRAGIIQRRKIISLRPGYKIEDGKLVRMSSTEKRKRHLGQVIGARKRKPLLSRILKRRALSLKRRKSAGIK